MGVGSLAPTFSLMGTDGVLRLSADGRVVVSWLLHFMCNHCTESQTLRSLRLDRLAQNYSGKGVAVVAIQSSGILGFFSEGSCVVRRWGRSS